MRTFALRRIVLADVAMIMLGLFGALSTNSYRWGYYGVSCAFFFVVLWGLFFPGAKGARARGGQVRKYLLYSNLNLKNTDFSFPGAMGACAWSGQISDHVQILCETFRIMVPTVSMQPGSSLDVGATVSQCSERPCCGAINGRQLGTYLLCVYLKLQ